MLNRNWGVPVNDARSFKMTRLQKAQFQFMTPSEKRIIYSEVQRLANNESYDRWNIGKMRIAHNHKIHRNHVNSIIRKLSGKTASVPKFHRTMTTFDYKLDG